MRAREFITEVGFRDLYPRTFAEFHGKYARFAGRGDLYVNFTDAVGNVLDKSFSPKPNHRDPSGLYAYPLEYVINHPMDVAYGQQARYLRVVQDTSKNKVDLQTVTREQAIEFLSRMGVEDPARVLGTVARTRPIFRNRPGGLFFAAMQGYTEVGQKTIHPNAVQTKLLLKAGIDALEDRAPNGGQAIIYPDEPEQIVFLTRSAFRVLDVFQLRPDAAGKNINYANRSEGLRRLPAMIAQAIGDRLVADATGGAAEPEQVYYTAAKRKIAVRMTEEDVAFGHRSRGQNSNHRVEVRLLGPDFEPIVAFYGSNVGFPEIAADIAKRFEAREAGDGEEFTRLGDHGADIKFALSLYGEIAAKLNVEFTPPKSEEVAFRIWRVFAALDSPLFTHSKNAADFIEKYVVVEVEKYLGALKTRPPQADQIIALYRAIAAKKGLPGYIKQPRLVAKQLGIIDWKGSAKPLEGDEAQRIELGEGATLIRAGSELHGEVGGRKFKMADIEKGELTDWRSPSDGGWYDQTVMLPHAAALAKYFNRQRFYLKGYHLHVAENYGLLYTEGVWKTLDDGVLEKDDIGGGFVAMMLPPDRDRDGQRHVVIRSSGTRDLRRMGAVPQKDVAWTDLLTLFVLNSENEVIALGFEMKQTLEFRKQRKEQPSWSYGNREHPDYYHSDYKEGVIETFKRLDAIGFDVGAYIQKKGYTFSPRMAADLPLFGLVTNTDTGKIGKSVVEVLDPVGEFAGMQVYTVTLPTAYDNARHYCVVEGGKPVSLFTVQRHHYDGKGDVGIRDVAKTLTLPQRAAARAVIKARGLALPKKFAPLLSPRA